MFLWKSLPNFLPKLPKQQKRLALFFASLCIFALAFPQLAPVSAQATQATVKEILDGNQVFIQNRQAAVNDVAGQPQIVRTGNSRTALLFNTGAVARLSANSLLKIGQCANLRRGTILINGAMNACSAGITTGVRGTTYLLEIDDADNQKVTVLEGEVVVTRNDTRNEKAIDDEKVKQFNFPQLPRINLPQDNPQPSRPLEPLKVNPASDKPVLNVEQNSQNNNSQNNQQSRQVVLKAGEKLEVDPKGVLGIVQQLSENEFVRLLKGNLFDGFTSQIPGLDKVRSAFEGLFPGANFPISLPNLPNLPNISLPRLPF
ncbi:MAG: hypothetical protein ACOYN8_11725 [Pseudanabaena sp.]|jgi:hypothetical protein